MRTRDKVAIGVAAGVGLLWGARAWRRSRRAITLDGRVVVVTGASSGHGFILAQEAARRGAHLVIAARSADELAKAEPVLARLGAKSVLSVPTDVRDEGQVRTMIDRAVSRHGRVDVLINNAGIISVGPYDSLTLDDFRDAMATNYWGAVYAIEAVVPHMKRAGFGRIGNVVSLGGKRAVPHMLPYTSSKFALAGFTQGLRSELAADNILVTGVYPGTMRTGGHTHALFKGHREKEYVWFALSDTVPLLSNSAEHTARKTLDGVCHGEAQVLVGWPSGVAVLLDSLLPNETAELVALVNRFLPTAHGATPQAIRGEDLKGTAAAVFNRAVPSSARPETA